MNESPNRAVALIDRLHDLLVWIANHGQSFALYLVRFGFGLPLAEDGLGKLLHVPKVTDYFTSLGIPFPELNVYVVGYTEMIGGVLLALGLLTRLTAVPMLFNFIVAYLTTEMDGIKDLFFFSPDKFFGDDAFADLVLSVVTLTFGPGALSLDYLICRWRRREWHGPKL